MPLRLIVFMFVMPAIWIALHVYMGRRLLKGVQGKSRRWGWAAIASLALLPVFAMSVTRFSDGALVRSVQWVGFLLMGIASVLFFGVLAVDLVRLARRGVRRLRTTQPSTPTDASRRGFMAKAANLGIVGSTGSIAAVGVVQARRMPEIVRIDVPIKGLPAALDGYLIAQITDIHVGPTIRGDYLRALVEQVNSLGADTIAVTGDLIDGYVESIGDEVLALADLDAPDGVYFVTGNHEYYWNGPAWCEHVASLGLTVLTNEHRIIERDGARVLMAGVTDYSSGGQTGGHRSDPARARQGAPACDVDILLAHQPRSVYAAKDAGYDLQISGHTHGGQYFPMSLMVHLVQPYVAGLARHEDTMWIYVSRGSAYWGPPLRVSAPHETTLLRLVAA